MWKRGFRPGFFLFQRNLSRNREGGRWKREKKRKKNERRKRRPFVGRCGPSRADEKRLPTVISRPISIELRSALLGRTWSAGAAAAGALRRRSPAPTERDAAFHTDDAAPTDVPSTKAKPRQALIWLGYIRFGYIRLDEVRLGWVRLGLG